MNRLKSVETWLYGLLAMFIGGGATAVTTATGLMVAKAVGVDVPILNFKAAGIVFLSSGLFNAFLYLKQSPLPKLEEGQTESLPQAQSQSPGQQV